MKTNSTVSIKGSNIPFFNFSKESFKLVCDMLEGDDMTLFMNSLYEYIYDGIEPEFKTKVLKSVWNNVISVADRKAESYFKTKAAAQENGKKGGRPRKNTQDIQPNNEFDIEQNEPIEIEDNVNTQPIQESVLNAQEIGNIDEVLIQYNIYPNSPAKESELKPISIKTGIPLDVLVLRQQELFKGFTDSIKGKFSKVS